MRRRAKNTLEGLASDFADVTLFSQLRTAETHRRAGGVFNDSALDPNYTTSLVANGTVTVLNGQANIAVTTDSGSSAFLTTVGVCRYIGSNSCLYRAPIRVGDLGASANLRAWGAVNDSTKTDGYWFQLNGTTFQIVTSNNGTSTVVSNGSFNGVSDSYTLDTSFHDYEIRYSGRRVKFVVDGVLIHTVTAGTTALSAIRHLKPFIQNTNTGVGSVVTISALSMAINLLGTPKTQPLNRHIAGATTGTLIKSGPGTLRALTINSSSNASTVALYDALNATDSTKAIAIVAMNVSAPPTYLPYEWDFNTGLYVVVVGASTDISINYE